MPDGVKQALSQEVRRTGLSLNDVAVGTLAASLADRYVRRRAASISVASWAISHWIPWKFESVESNDAGGRSTPAGGPAR